jgi:hypothetical protein
LGNNSTEGFITAQRSAIQQKKKISEFTHLGDVQLAKEASESSATRLSSGTSRGKPGNVSQLKR